MPEAKQQDKIKPNRQDRSQLRDQDLISRLWIQYQSQTLWTKRRKLQATVLNLVLGQSISQIEKYPRKRPSLFNNSINKALKTRTCRSSSSQGQDEVKCHHSPKATFSNRIQVSIRRVKPVPMRFLSN